IERALDAFHRFDGRLAKRHSEIGRFGVTDAVFGADRPTQFEGRGESLTHGFARAPHGLAIVAVAHEVDVDVPIARVAKIDDEAFVSLRDLLDALDQLRDA